jgi:hypothetical protein
MCWDQSAHRFDAPGDLGWARLCWLFCRLCRVMLQSIKPALHQNDFSHVVYLPSASVSYVSALAHAFSVFGVTDFSQNALGRALT